MNGGVGKFALLMIGSVEKVRWTENRVVLEFKVWGLWKTVA